ncbi:hypothetical protein INR49_024451, partial [Caranx melampygus]
MLQVSTGALLLFLPWFGCLVLGEVSKDFSSCLDFFYDQTPPQGINGAEYQPICQRYKNQYRFASLYNRQHRTPLYSAYILSPPNGKRPNSTWMFEPQLAFSRADSEMKPFPDPVDQNVIESQAERLDYKNSNFTKGHLNPSMHQQTKEDREATFTLTNIVPQRAGSNSGPWSILENEMLRKFKAYCDGPMYVITGAMPYESGALIFPTYAAVGRNDRNSGEEIVPVNAKARASVRGYDVRRMTLETLEGILRQRLAMPI